MEFSRPETEVGSLSLFQGIFPTQGSNSGLSHCRQILYQLSHKRSQRILEWVAYPFSRGSSWWGKSGKWHFVFLDSKIAVDDDCSHEIKRRLLLGRKAITNLDSVLKCKDITLLTGLCSQSYGFSSSHVQMWELDHKGVWVPRNWCF